MTGFISQLLGQNNKPSAAASTPADQALQTTVADDQAQIKSEQGQQLKLLSQQQAQTDDEAAQINKPGLGRQQLQFQRQGGAAATLGG